eukprot:TRINITY_DN1501_c0_g1_i1.p1 TRINITY_DN1501_c0_g1~~TRINITY_DN1501_c0_g1_i1.p1  ORF type:complete len:1168 (-),score=306.28 TRINITY_DN1501_c0_g1_i1:527-4030(-)
MIMITLLWGVVATMSLFMGSVDGRKSYLVATVDIHPVDETVDVVNGTAELGGAGPVTMSRLMSPAALSPLTGVMSLTGFPMTVPAAPKDATTYLEIAFSVPAGGSFGGVYVYATAVAGPNAPVTYSVSSSMDGFATAADTFTMSQQPGSEVTAVSVNVTMFIRSPTILPDGSTVIVRVTAASAPRNGTSADAWFGLTNHAEVGRVAVYAAPFRCPMEGGNGCTHGVWALESRSRSLASPAHTSGTLNRNVKYGDLDHGDFGTYDCTRTDLSGNVPASGVMQDVLVQCQCDCYADPPKYDPCDDSSKTHLFAGTVCAGGGPPLTSASDVLAYDACDTLDGSLVIKLSSAITVEFPRVRRIIGLVTVDPASQGRVRLPLLEYCAGVQVEGLVTTGFETPRLRGLCGGALVVKGTGMSALQLPMLGRRALEALELQSPSRTLAVDIGSMMGGPEALLGSPSTTRVLGLEGLTDLVGLSALRRVLPAPGASSSVVISYNKNPTVVAPLRDVEIGGEEGESRDVAFEFEGNDFSSSGSVEVEFSSLRAVTGVIVSSNKGLLALRAPRVSGAAWRQLAVQANNHLVELDLGSVSGGPGVLDCTLVYCLYVLGYSSSVRIQRVDGMSRLRAILGPASGGGLVRLQYVGANAFASGFQNATFGTSTRRVKIDISYATLPTTLAFPGVVELTSLSVVYTDSGSSLLFPNLAGDVMESLNVYYNTDLNHVDLGSVGGGPMSFDSTESILCQVSTRLPIFIALEGLWRTTSFVGRGSSPGQVTFQRLTMPSFPASLLAASYRGSPVGISLMFDFVDVAGGSGEIVFPNATDILKLQVTSSSGFTTWRFPSLTATTMERVYFYGNPGVHTADFGSVSGGPRAIVGRSGAALIIGGSGSTHLTTIQGLDQVELVSCATSGTTVCSVSFLYLDTLPMHLLEVTTTYGLAGAPMGLGFSFVTLSQPIEAIFPNVTQAYYVTVTGNSGVTALRVPYWNSAESRSADVGNNADMHTVDLGSVGGGPVMLFGQSSPNAYLLRLSGTATQPIETFLGMQNLEKVGGHAKNFVTFEFLAANASTTAQALLDNVTFSTGDGVARLVVADTAFTKMRVSGAAGMYAIDVSNNALLTSLKFPAMPANGVNDTTSIINNAVLPDGCATDLAPLTVGMLTQSGNLASTACPA